MKKQLNEIKGYLVVLHQAESDPIDRGNIEHLIACLDELIVGRKRMTDRDVLDEFVAYSQEMVELLPARFRLEKALRNK